MKDAPETRQAARDIGEMVRIVKNGRSDDWAWERAMFRLGSVVELYDLDDLRMLFCVAVTMIEDSGYLDIDVSDAT